MSIFVAVSAWGCESGAASEVVALRREVAGLRAEVAALKARLDGEAAANTGPAQRKNASHSPDPDAKISSATVTWTFEVKPDTAHITVGEETVEGRTWSGPAGKVERLVQVRRMGFRTAKQLVIPDRDRLLRYRLAPGRGVEQLPSP